MNSHRAERPRTPWAWWARLGTWAVVLVVGIGAFVLVVDTGSASSTKHSFQTDRVIAPVQQLRAEVDLRTTKSGARSALSGPTVAVFSGSGAVGYDSTSGAKIWSYQRSDTEVCASGANSDTVVLVYRTGKRCDQAIGLNATTGATTWQRTFETKDGNRVIFGSSNILVLSASTLNVIDFGSAYQRFQLVASTPTGDDPKDTRSCQFLDASATISIVTVLQRCRTNPDAAWKLQVLSENEDQGQPREVSRVDINDAKVDLLGTLDDGSAMLNAAAAGVLIVASKGGKPYQLTGVDVGPETEVGIFSNGGTDVISVGTTLYALASDHRSVRWSTTSASTPDVSLDAVSYVVNGALNQVQTVTGAAQAVVPMTPTPSTDVGALATLTLIRGVVGLTTADGTTTYS